MKPPARRDMVAQDVLLAVRVDHRLRNSFHEACEKNETTAAMVLRALMAAYVHKTMGT
jgi:hypothetical protein